MAILNNQKNTRTNNYRSSIDPQVTVAIGYLCHGTDVMFPILKTGWVKYNQERDIMKKLCQRCHKGSKENRYN